MRMNIERGTHSEDLEAVLYIVDDLLEHLMDLHHLPC